MHSQLQPNKACLKCTNSTGLKQKMWIDQDSEVVLNMLVLHECCQNVEMNVQVFYLWLLNVFITPFPFV